MKIVDKHYIVRRGWLVESRTIDVIEEELAQAIGRIVWPEGADGFYLDPISRKGNGVKPIKDACVTHLADLGWQPEQRSRPHGVAGTGPLDLVRPTNGGLFALEWETGNISSSHRAVNKMCLGILDQELIGGTLVVPSDKLYPYLTDRVGNYRELQPYLSLWERLPFSDGVLAIVVIEQDGFQIGAPRIRKGTDGRALA